MKTFLEQAKSTPSVTRRAFALLVVPLSAVAAGWLTAGAAANFQSESLQVVEASYVRTSLATADGQTTTEEVGRFRIADDGRYRIDRTVDGKLETVLASAADGSMLTLHYDSREAIRGPAPLPFAFSSLPDPRAPDRGGPAAERGVSDVRAGRESLGTKMVGDLQLHGTRFANNISTDWGQVTHVFEVWDYRFGTPSLLPIVIEQRIETPETVEERRIVTAVTRIEPGDLFDVPSGFTVR